MKITSFRVQILLIIIGITVFYHDSLCQKTPKYTHSISVSAFKGFIYLHSSKIGHLVTNHTTGFELSYDKQTNGTKSWEADHNYPAVGYSIGYYDYGNDALGKTISMHSYIRYALLKSRNPHDLRLHLGFGLGFNTNPYDQEENNTNNILGSTVTFSLQGRIIYSYNYKYWQFSIAPNLTHFSNGSIKQPNMGVNIFSLNLGVARKIGDPIEFNAPTLTSFSKAIKLNFAIYSGIKSYYEGGDTFGFLTLHGSVNRRYTAKSGASTGLDFFYSPALKNKIENDARNPTEELPDFRRIGWTVGYEYYISNLSVVAQFGVYLYKPYKNLSPVYQRLGLKYYATNTLFIAASLKTHGGVAELAEFGLGIQL